MFVNSNADSNERKNGKIFVYILKMSSNSIYMYNLCLTFEIFDNRERNHVC